MRLRIKLTLLAVIMAGAFMALNESAVASTCCVGYDQGCTNLCDSEYVACRQNGTEPAICYQQLVNCTDNYCCIQWDEC
jgi:hypothetical protein